MANEKISQLQLLEQGMQSFNMQKQQLQARILENESALEELDGTDTSYKIIGNIMVKIDKDKLKKDIEEELKSTEIRIKAVEKQESSMKEKAKKLQQEVMEEMKNDRSTN
ncbi:MAG: prefoldin subunit [Candidatus Woesearchaeota archaeon]